MPVTLVCSRCGHSAELQDAELASPEEPVVLIYKDASEADLWRLRSNVVDLGSAAEVLETVRLAVLTWGRRGTN